MTREATDRFEIDLSCLLDGELEPERVLPLLDALLDRPDLQAFYRAGRELDHLIAESVRPDEASAASVAKETREWQWPLSRIGTIVGRSWRWIPVPTWAIGAVAALVVAVLAWKAAPDGSTILRIGPGAVSEMGGRSSMTDHRFVEMTAELLQAEPRYQRKMLEVMNEVESLRSIPEGSNEGQGRRSEELGAEDGSRESAQVD